MGRYLDLMRAAKCEKSEIIRVGKINSLISQLQGHPEAPGAAPVCAVCGATGDLWCYGEALAHQECARLLPKSESAELSAAQESVSAGPEGGCRVQVVEIPATGLRYRRTFAHLQLRPPAHVPEDRWRQCVQDGSEFLARWGEQTESLGWDSRDLFGLHTPPEQPHPSYNRLSRYDCTGLVWLLQARSVVALTANTAAIRNPKTGNVTVYRRFNKPALGPVGDSLEDLT
jgi:hypothetical protein